jgi:hypothetical protein
MGEAQVCNNICAILSLGEELVVKMNVFIILIFSLIHCQFPTFSCIIQ